MHACIHITLPPWRRLTRAPRSLGRMLHMRAEDMYIAREHVERDLYERAVKLYQECVAISLPACLLSRLPFCLGGWLATWVAGWLSGWLGGCLSGWPGWLAKFCCCEATVAW